MTTIEVSFIAFGVGLIVAYASVLAICLMLGANQSPSVTMHARRDGLPPVRRDPPTMRACKAVREADMPDEPIYMYGVTGEER
jgi:hypothetical protein